MLNHVELHAVVCGGNFRSAVSLSGRDGYRPVDWILHHVHHDSTVYDDVIDLDILYPHHVSSIKEAPCFRKGLLFLSDCDVKCVSQVLQVSNVSPLRLCVVPVKIDNFIDRTPRFVSAVLVFRSDARVDHEQVKLCVIAVLLNEVLNLPLCHHASSIKEPPCFRKGVPD